MALDITYSDLLDALRTPSKLMTPLLSPQAFSIEDACLSEMNSFPAYSDDTAMEDGNIYDLTQKVDITNARSWYGFILESCYMNLVIKALYEKNYAACVFVRAIMITGFHIMVYGENSTCAQLSFFRDLVNHIITKTPTEQAAFESVLKSLNESQEFLSNWRNQNMNQNMDVLECL